jgi:hypothetical protein
MTSNKGRCNDFRRKVIDELHRAGLVNAHRPIEHKGLTISERLRRDHGDIIGLPWTLAVSAAQTLDLSGMQNEVRAQAERGGCDLYAAIHKRKNHPVAGAFVVMPLATFIETLRRLHPEELLSAQVRAGSSG